MPLTVKVVKAVGLPKADFKGHGDFFVRVVYGGEVQNTGVVSGEDPVWGETVEFPGEGTVVKLEVREKDEFSEDDIMGGCEVTPGDGVTEHSLQVGDAGAELTFSTILNQDDIDGTPPPPSPEADEQQNNAEPQQHDDEDDKPEPILTGVQGKALLIGINYVGQDHISLTQSVQSVRALSDTLKAEGFNGSIRILADDGAIDSMPTKRNIEDSISWLTTNTQPQDGLILYYAGRLRREDDGTVGICPADHKESGDILARDVVSRLKRTVGCRVLWVLDTPGGGSVSPASHQPVLPFRVTCPETDLANFSPPVAGQNGVWVLSAASLEAMVEGAMCDGLSGALRGMRGQAETAMDEAGRLFVKRVHGRFPGLLDGVMNEGGYVSTDFAAWGEKSLQDLQTELSAFGVPTTRAAPLQNIAQQFFKDPPGEEVHTPTPPSLSTLMQRIHDSHPSSKNPNFTILCESDSRIDPETPFLPACPTQESTLYTQPAVQPAILPYTDNHFTTTNPHHEHWATYIGYISTGGDILGSPRLMTVEEAVELAKNYPECKGFSLRGENPNPGERTWVYFKNKWDLHGSGWTTYKRPDAVGGGAVVDYNSGNNNPLVGRDIVTPPHSVSPSRGHGIDPWFRQRLVSFYNHYNPSKLPSVVPTLMEYTGHEETLFRSLTQKYGPEPPDTMADPLAPGWRLVESPQGDLYYKHVDGRKQWERPLDVVYNVPRGY